LAGRILQTPERANDTVQVFEDDPDERMLEVMVATAPMAQIQANPIAWALFMRGFEVGCYLMDMSDDEQESQEQDPHEQIADPRINQMSEEIVPSMVMEMLMETVSEPVVETETSAEVEDDQSTLVNEEEDEDEDEDEEEDDDDDEEEEEASTKAE